MNCQPAPLAFESRFVGPRCARSEAETPTTDGIDTGILDYLKAGNRCKALEGVTQENNNKDMAPMALCNYSWKSSISECFIMILQFCHHSFV